MEERNAGERGNECEAHRRNGERMVVLGSHLQEEKE